MAFDYHIHIARLPEPLDLCRALSVRGYKFNAIACEPWEWEKLDEIWNAGSKENLFEGCGIAFGIHPQIADSVPDSWQQELTKLLEKYPSAAVGEAGIDRRFPGYEAEGKQEQIFIDQVQLARQLHREIQIHCVGDYGRIIGILKHTLGNAKLESAIFRPIFHRFGGDASIVKQALALGSIFSIHDSSFRKKSTEEAIRKIPKERIRVETDADESFCQLEELRNGTPEVWAEYLCGALRNVVKKIL